MKRFEQTLDRIDNSLASMTNRVDIIRGFYDQSNMRACYLQTLRLEETAERLTLFARSLPVYTGARTAPEDVAQIIREVIPVQIGFTDDGWFCLRLPMLLPKKDSGSVNYLRGFLFQALSDFFREKAPVRYLDCVIILRHVYDRTYPKRRWRDHDNIETKLLIDAVALHVLPDDGPENCCHYACSDAGGSERTELYIVPRAEFPQWLAKQDSIPEKGVLLHENSPDMSKSDM